MNVSVRKKLTWTWQLSEKFGREKRRKISSINNDDKMPAFLLVTYFIDLSNV